MSDLPGILLRLAIACALIVASNAPADQVTRPYVRIGLVVDGSTLVQTRIANALREQLNKLGYVEGKNFSLEERMSNGEQTRLPSLVRELLDRD
jgi:hypothetical protein